jgi:hypothetical protein
VRLWFVCLLLFVFCEPALAGQSPPVVSPPSSPLAPQSQQAVFVWPGIVVRVPQPYVQTWIGPFGKVHSRIIWR